MLTLSNRSPRGFTMIELAALIAALAALVSLIGAVQDQASPAQRARQTMKDATQLTQIHKAMLTFSRQFEGELPRPGKVNTVGNEPGVGAEDASLNTTANLYSSCICQNYFTPALVVSPLEPNEKVTVKKDYGYDDYMPLKDTYWDSTFAADLEAGSNASYAHLPIAGKRGRLHWRDTLDPDFAILGNRGPKDGKDDPSSLTYKILGDGTAWKGNVVFADGHAELLDTFTPRPAPEGQEADNIFADGGDTDMWLTFTRAIVDDKPDVQWD